MAEDSLQRLTAFSDVAEGGNPAGVWLGPALPTADEMLRTAAEVGYSETVFASREQSARSAEEGSGGDDPSLEVRYFSPEREVTFCGHATIALGARLAAERGAGRYILHTAAGLWRESAGVVHARNLFPVGGVVEDPATGAAAAALGGHLCLTGELDGPADFIVHQGVDMGRPSLLEVHVPATGGIEVSGAAVALGREGDR